MNTLCAIAMTVLDNPSPEELSSRRHALKKQRRIRNLQTIWRVFAISGLATGSIWLISNPVWLMLRSRDQIVIEGNEILADAAIQDLIALDYPQPLLEIEPEDIAERLRTHSTIALAQVERQLFPPRLQITLQERQPVAVTIPSKPSTTALTDTTQTPGNAPGLIDSEGYWMSQDGITLGDGFELPGLRILGFHQRYQSQWPELYQSIQSSPVKIIEIDWRSPTNLVLNTAIGRVHLGVYEAQRLRQQLAILPRFRSLSLDSQVPAIEFIDLSNPQSPAVKLAASPNSESNTP